MTVWLHSRKSHVMARINTIKKNQRFFGSRSATTTGAKGDGSTPGKNILLKSSVHGKDQVLRVRLRREINAPGVRGAQPGQAQDDIQDELQLLGEWFMAEGNKYDVTECLINIIISF
jgi:hypothetical protein